jgi:tetratricopeptide (TPR) repeat protein
MVMTRIYLALLVAWLPLASLAAPTIQEADQAFRQGQYSAALDKVNAFLASNGKDAQGRFLKGLILTELNRHADAIKVFTALADDYPELPEPYNNLAVLYAAQGQYDQAKQSLEMAIRTHPSYATAHENLGDIYAKMASQSYDKALQLDRTNTSAQTKLALIRELFNPGGRSSAPTVAKVADKPAQVAKPAAVAVEPAAPPAVVTPAEKFEQPGIGGAAPPATADTAQPEAAAKAEVASQANTPAKLVKAWADAWSRQDVPTYLTYYSPDYAPKGLDHATWAAQRKERIERPQSIAVEISHLRAQVKGDSAKVSFRQRYTSERIKSNDKKTLVLKKSNGSWLIVEER